jgi:hypothetical protein
MTLRTIESEFSDELLKQTLIETKFDLTVDGKVITKLHPKLIWSKLQLKHNPEMVPLSVQIPGWHYDCFENLALAEAKYPQIPNKFTGRPWAIFQFLEKNETEAIIDFGDLGSIVLSKNELGATPKSELAWHQLPLWTSYALSPELWGAPGKWSRFHLRLIKLFEDSNLLENGSKTGYYILKPQASKLATAGFIGTAFEKSYVLVLPWSFSLTALEKLEKTIRQEF